MKRKKVGDRGLEPPLRREGGWSPLLLKPPMLRIAVLLKWAGSFEAAYRVAKRGPAARARIYFVDHRTIFANRPAEAAAYIHNRALIQLCSVRPVMMGHQAPVRPDFGGQDSNLVG